MRKLTKGLIKAARKGNVNLATRLIGPRRLSHRPEWLNGYKFLRIALQENNTAFAKFLLEKGCPTNRPPRRVSADTAKFQLEKGSSSNRPPKKGKAADGTPLQFAIVYENLEIIELLLTKGADVNNDRTSDGETPLTFAVEKKSLPIVKLLLDHGANVNLLDDCGWSPLHGACENNLEEIACLLLARGADCNSMTANGYAPIHLAIRSLRYRDTGVGIVKPLLDHGAQVDTKDKDGKTALNLAVYRERLEVVQIILTCHPDVNIESNQRCLEIALRDCGTDMEIVTALLDYGFTVKPEFVKDAHVFRGAIKKGNVKIVEELIQYGAIVNPVENLFEKTPLHIAVKNRHEQVVKLLISHKADVNAKNLIMEPPIHFSVANADLKITQLLLSSGAIVKDVPDLLQMAVRLNSIEIIETLLVHGADIDSKDLHKRTALHFTVYNEKEARFAYDSDDDDIFAFLRNDIEVLPNFEVAQFLLRKGANVDAQSENGLTALHGSVRKGFNSMVHLLLSHNANLNLGDRDGLGPLHIAAETGNKEITAALLKKGAKVNGTTKKGNTALHLAVSKSHKEVVKLLIENGAHVNFRGKHGKVPLHYASDPDIINFLWMSGADIDSRCDKGKTALLHATDRGDLKGGDLKSVIALLEHGADINITCSASQTIFDIAMQSIMVALFSDMMFVGVPVDPSCGDIAKFLNLHYVKMDAADMPYKISSHQNVGGRRSSQADLLFKCYSELESMKSKCIGDTNVTYHDILKKDTFSLAKFMNNECMVQTLDSKDLRAEFPLYAGMLNGQLRRGMGRFVLLEAANRVLRRIIDLPEVCTEKIMDDLSDEDLRVLIDAGKSEG